MQAERDNVKKQLDQLDYEEAEDRRRKKEIKRQHRRKLQERAQLLAQQQ